MKNIKIAIPRRFSAFLIFAFSNALIFSLLRVIFYFISRPSQVLDRGILQKSFIIGARFDLRLAFLLALPLGIAFLFPYKKWLKKFLCFFYALAFGLLMLLYFTDFGYYAYLGERLNAYIFALAAETVTSLEMVWQSYPVIKGALALLALMVVYFVFVSKLLAWVYAKTSPKKHYWYALPALLIAAVFIHGRVSQYPLRWSNAYFTPNTFATSLALNPAQNLFDTYAFAKKGEGFSVEETRKFYDIIAAFLGVKNKDREALNFTRSFLAAPGGVKDYNVVIILTESFSYDKTSFAGPELDTTPNALALAKQGLLFTRFFTPTIGTARGVFATITGLPDTSAVETASRNPKAVHQHTLINDLKGYAKFYFIGGSTNWGNVRGILQNNIEGLRIFEEGAYPGASRTDVWGISDLDMFRYAAKELKASKKPFFAFLQTAGYHRPYTIPKDHGSFEAKKVGDAWAKSYGFTGGEEEYNSIRFQDYAMGEFFRAIENEPFYKNTIFFILGDHGLAAHPKNTPQALIDLDLVQNHTPLIIIAPGLKPAVDNKPASQIDITATMAGLLGMPYTASALGQDLLNPATSRGAFILTSASAPLRMGFIEDDFYYVQWPSKKGMYKYMSDDSKTDYCPQYPRQCQRMDGLTRGFYESARFITFHHKP